MCRETHEYLLDLRTIHRHYRGMAGIFGLQPDTLADQRLQHRARIFHQMVEVDIGGIEGLLADKIYEASCEFDGLIGLSLVLGQRVDEGIVLLEGGPHHLAVALLDHEDVVEFVSEAAGQLSHRLRPLGL